MILIAAMTEKRVIGNQNGLPWHIPEEYQHFLSCIDGQTTIAGRRSYEIFGPDLSSAHDFVISRKQLAIPGVYGFNNIEAAYRDAQKLGKEIFCIGGASIYAAAMPFATKMYLSFIKHDYPGDVYFPDFRMTEWAVELQRAHDEFTFKILTPTHS